MNKSYLTSAVIFFTLFFISCNQDDPKKKETNTESEAKLVEQWDKNLSSLKDHILPLTKSHKFKNTVYREVDKRFDGEDNVLLKTLINDASSPLTRSSSEVTQAIQFFKEKTNKELHPQIYIPFYEEVKERNKKGVVEDVVLVPFNGYEKDEYEGYVLDKENSIKKLDFLINEEYAKAHEVWVISINENEGKPRAKEKDIIAKNNSSQRTLNHCEGLIATGPTPAGIDLYIENMNITSHRESWAAGGSEIYMNRTTAWGNGINPYTGSVQSGTVYDIGYADKELTFVRRGDVGKMRTVNIRFSDMSQSASYFNPNTNICNSYYVNAWGEQNHEYPKLKDVRRDHFFYVIYEHDERPSGTWRRAIVTANPGKAVELLYHSADELYDAACFSWYPYDRTGQSDYIRRSNPTPCQDVPTVGWGSGIIYNVKSTTAFFWQ